MRLRRATAMVVNSCASFDEEPFVLGVVKLTSQTCNNTMMNITVHFLGANHIFLLAESYILADSKCNTHDQVCEPLHRACNQMNQILEGNKQIYLPELVCLLEVEPPSLLPQSQLAQIVND